MPLSFHTYHQLLSEVSHSLMSGCRDGVLWEKSISLTSGKDSTFTFVRTFFSFSQGIPIYVSPMASISWF